MKKLRELPAPDGSGKRLRWNNLDPEIQVNNGTWRYASPSETLDYADAYRDLRAAPWEEKVDPVVEAIKRDLTTRVASITYTSHPDQQRCAEVIAATIRPLVLASTPTEALVGELVKRGAVRERVRVTDLRSTNADPLGKSYTEDRIILPAAPTDTTGGGR